ncbi:MAG: flagellar basal body rod protein FlgB [Hyphomicrobiales bacterium]|jgi:flagellar basal-body rod protein FlgB
MLRDLPFFSALRTQMQWHSARQSVLAENIANADTPGFQARDLQRVDHESQFSVTRPMATAPVRTDAKHIAGRAVADTTAFDNNRQRTFEVTPEGNSVVLEEEVMKMTANQLDYQTVATLYQKSLGMLRTAVGRR